MYEFYGTWVVERLCVLLGICDVCFEHVRFTHRALTRPLGTTTTTTTNNNNDNNDNANNNNSNNNKHHNTHNDTTTTTTTDNSHTNDVVALQCCHVAIL